MHKFSLSASDAASIGKGCTEGEATRTSALQQTERVAKEVFFNTLQAWLSRKTPTEMRGTRLYGAKYVAGAWITESDGVRHCTGSEDKAWDLDDRNIYGRIKVHMIRSKDFITETYGFAVVYNSWNYAGMRHEDASGVTFSWIEGRVHHEGPWTEFGHVTGFPEDFYIVGQEQLLEDCVSTLTSKGFVVSRCSTGRLNVVNPYFTG